MSARHALSYATQRAELLERLRAEPVLTRLQLDGETDWIVALCEAWAALAQVIGFYQARIAGEAFLATAEQPSSVDLIYHSLGHTFPPNATATTTLAYHLTSVAAGVEAVARARTAGGTGTTPQERARATGDPAATAAGTPLAGAAGDGVQAPGSPPLADGSAPAPGSVPGADGSPAAAPGMPAADGSVPAAAGPGGIGATGAQGTGLPSVGTPAGIQTHAPPLTTPASAVGVATQIPPAAQVRAIPTAAGKPPLFVTLAPLGAYVGMSRLPVSFPKTTPPPALSAKTTQLELAGAKTGLAIGHPVVVAATGGKPDAPPPRWVRVLTSLTTDAKRGSTRIGWDAPLGSVPGEPPAKGATDPVVYGFAHASQLVAASPPAWDSLPVAQQLAARTTTGRPVPVRGGFARSADNGATWTLDSTGLPPGVDLTAVAAYDDVVIVAAGTALLRAAGDAPFAPATLGGGARRAVGFLGGTPQQLLAGAANGTVYESADMGRTWTAVTGPPPEIVPPSAPAPNGAADATGVPAKGDATTAPPSPPARSSVATHQLPPAVVRCVIQDPSSPASARPGWLLAGTDLGLYAYRDGKWAVPENTPAALATKAVFDLLVTPLGVVAATSSGVEVRGADGTWAPPPAGAFHQRTYALATSAAGALYAGTDDGVHTDASGEWQLASGAGGGSITSLLVVGDDLFAASADGIRCADITAATVSWRRVDHTPAFTIARAAFEPPAATRLSGAPPAGLVAAFADYGIALGADTTFTASQGAGYLLEDGAHAYGVQLVGAAWEVTLLDALGDVAALAVRADGTILAAAAAATSTATQWPGFAVTGTQVEIAPPLRDVASGMPALIEQRTSQPPASQVLDVVAVEQDSCVRAGRQTPLTRLSFAGPPLAPGAYPRAASTVWSGSKTLPLFDPPPTAVTRVEGTQLPLASQLPAPVEPGRLATVTGAPPGLAVAPLGGATRVAAAGAAPTAVGPPQADVLDTAVTAAGDVYLATGEGVFELAAGAAPGAMPQLVDQNWPGGSSPAVAIAGGTAIAASPADVQILAPATGGAPASWRAAGLGAVAVAALAGAGATAAAATADGSVHVTQDIAQTRPAWTALPALAHPATALALAAPKLYAATGDGVFAADLSDGAWTACGAPSAPAPTACLLIDAGGTVWAGSVAGVYSFDPRTETWMHDPAVSGPVQALCLSADHVLMAGGPFGVVAYRDGRWAPVAGPTGSSLGAIAAAADGSLWLGARAALALGTAPGAPAQELGHEPVFSGVRVAQRDIETLEQGAVPPVLLAAFADAGHTLDPAHVVVAADGPGCWAIRSAADLYIAAQRNGRWGPAVLAYRNQAVVYPTAPATTKAGVQTWTVEANGAAASLTAPATRIIQLPAGSDAPALAENANVAAAAAGAPVTTVGAGTTLPLKQPLAHVYDASTVTINLNVVPAAQGQPTSIPIGSGDPHAAHQTFAIPTPVAAIGATPANPAVAAPQTSLRVYVDGQPWSEVPALHHAGPRDAVYVAQHDRDGTARVTFGDGVHGARLPAGQNNVVATYLGGGGAGGEVAQGALIQPLDRPQLVRNVHNPMAGMVPTVPSARASRLAAVRRLDRIVTLEDYEQVARALPGVATATAEVVSSASGSVVVVTVAPGTAAPQDLLHRVRGAVGTTSASGLAVRVATATIVPVRACVRIISRNPAIAPAVRAALGGRSAERPGAPLLAARLLSAATAVDGVLAAQIDRWARAGARPLTATSLHAARARWPAHSRLPSGAELLLIDASEQHLEIDVQPPPRVSPT